MARQDHGALELCAAAQALIHEHSQDIAKEHNLELDLIYQILERDAVHFCEYVHTYKGIPPHTPEAVSSGGVLYCPSFFAALRYVPPQIAFNLFSGKLEPNSLGTLELFVDHYLAVPRTPLHTLEELENLTADFLDHLDRNRRPLLDFGLPEIAFSECPWLDDSPWTALSDKITCLCSEDTGQRSSLPDVWLDRRTAAHDQAAGQRIGWRSAVWPHNGWFWRCSSMH
jgi:hypothetical protein